MGETGLVHVRRAGREKRYWMERERWSEFLGLNFTDPQQLAARSEAAGRLVACGTEAKDSDAPGREGRSRAAEELLKASPEPESRAPMDDQTRRAVLRLPRPEIAWVNWSRLYRGLARILRHLRQPGWEKLADYVQSSEFARTVEWSKDDLEAAERGLHLPVREGASLEAHVSALERAVEWLVDSIHL
jgi:hypothetical protein